jgi:hypothetical protein
VDIPRSVVSVDEAAARVEAAIKAKLVTSFAALVDATDIAVDTLVSIAVNGRREDARVAAAKEILDRSGLTPDIRVSVDVVTSERDARLAELRSKLDKMKHGLTAAIEVGEGQTA